MDKGEFLELKLFRSFKTEKEKEMKKTLKSSKFFKLNAFFQFQLKLLQIYRVKEIKQQESKLALNFYKQMWRSKFHPITQKTLPIHFSVDPVGTEIM